VERDSGHDLFGLEGQDRQAILDWVGEHLAQVRRSVYDQRLLHWSLGIAFVVGLAVYVGGYALRSSVTTEPLELVGDAYDAALGEKARAGGDQPSGDDAAPTAR